LKLQPLGSLALALQLALALFFSNNKGQVDDPPPDVAFGYDDPLGRPVLMADGLAATTLEK